MRNELCSSKDIKNILEHLFLCNWSVGHISEILFKNVILNYTNAFERDKVAVMLDELNAIINRNLNIIPIVAAVDDADFLGFQCP